MKMSKNAFNNLFSRLKDEIASNKTLYLCLSVLLFVITIMAWQCDDAFHSHIMSRNLAEGYGLVYNIG
ncbi:MAG: hypothetical protein LBH29_06045, partial [Elusimicrobiota bacterium]|nr:hypothetical protein [Elusimicrobiota bacterium]